MFHVTNGDAVVPELAAAAGVAEAEVLAWRDILHDGPVPAALSPVELAARRAAFLADRHGLSAAAVRAELLERDARLAARYPHEEVVLWFEDDLYDALQLAQIADRLVGRPGPVSRIHLPHSPRGDLRAALRAREPFVPDPPPVRRSSLARPARVARDPRLRAPRRGAAERTHRAQPARARGARSPLGRAAVAGRALRRGGGARTAALARRRLAVGRRRRARAARRA